MSLGQPQATTTWGRVEPFDSSKNISEAQMWLRSGRSERAIGLPQQNLTEHQGRRISERPEEDQRDEQGESLTQRINVPTGGGICRNDTVARRRWGGGQPITRLPEIITGIHERSR